MSKKAAEHHKKASIHSGEAAKHHDQAASSMRLANTRRPLITLTPLQVTSANLECMPTKPQRRTLMSTAKSPNNKRGVG